MKTLAVRIRGNVLRDGMELAGKISDTTNNGNRFNCQRRNGGYTITASGEVENDVLFDLVLEIITLLDDTRPDSFEIIVKNTERTEKHPAIKVDN